jgi:hypothetical protein
LHPKITKHLTKQEQRHWKCLDCGRNCFLYRRDYYMVTNEVWVSIGMKRTQMLCMDCLEGRLGHSLEKKEILDCEVTREWNPYTKKILTGK